MAKREKPKSFLTLGKRKNAIARATITAGTGKIRVNGVPLALWGSEFLRMKIQEPLFIAGDVVSKVDIDVNAHSGGITGQADAVRMAIAKSLANFFKEEKLRQKFIQYDRNLMVFDPRRNEPHKPGASKRGARRHKQRSKR
jgi:small subunit ribosomal protein S9